MSKLLTHTAPIQIAVDWTLRRAPNRSDPILVEPDRRPEAVARSVWRRVMDLAAAAAIDPLTEAVHVRLRWPTRTGDLAEVDFRPTEADSIAALEYQLVWGVARTLERNPPA